MNAEQQARSGDRVAQAVRGLIMEWVKEVERCAVASYAGESSGAWTAADGAVYSLTEALAGYVAKGYTPSVYVGEEQSAGAHLHRLCREAREKAAGQLALALEGATP